MGKIVKIHTTDGEAVLDTETNKLHIKTPDGGLLIRSGGLASLKKPKSGTKGFYDNLAEDLEDGYLGTMASQLLEAIRSDLQSSSGRREDITHAIKLLALKVEEGSTSSSAVSGQSTVRSPLLLKAVLAFQANAVGELLPAGGPVKVRFDGHEEDKEAMESSEDLEKDLNHYLTTTASEYYPDTTRMLFDNVGLAGAGFKKVYRDPLRKRPVIESVATEDFIVPAGATDIRNAQRVTHSIRMNQSTMKRMQAMGHYLDVPLTPPSEAPSNVESAKAQTQGLGATPSLPASYRHTLYECYCEWDLPGEYAHTGKAKRGEDAEPSGMPLPYRVTIDVNSQKVLEVRRDWVEGDELYERRKTFVKWPFIEALGFYGIGLMHILGNTTEAMTAAWRLLLDAGFFSNFPGFLIAQDATRGQQTTVIRIAPGTGQGVNTGGRPISDTVMPLPYKGPDQAFIALANLLTEAGEQVGGIAGQSVGEGKQDAPVGTTIALLEQATKMMGAVHKGLHAAQSEEFQMLKDLFREDPEAFWRHNKKPARQWDEAAFIAALDNSDIVPCADPNTPSHMHRVMRAVALVQLATAFPDLVDLREVADIAITVLGWDASVLLKPPPDPNAQNQPPQVPVDPVGMAAVDAKKAGDQLKAQTDQQDIAARMQDSAADRASKEKIAGAQIAAKTHDTLHGAVADRAKLAEQARMNNMKALGIGQGLGAGRVI